MGYHIHTSLSPNAILHACLLPPTSFCPSPAIHPNAFHRTDTTRPPHPLYFLKHPSLTFLTLLADIPRSPDCLDAIVASLTNLSTASAHHFTLSTPFKPILIPHHLSVPLHPARIYTQPKKTRKEKEKKVEGGGEETYSCINSA
jgi:hypothetical protein